VTHYRATGVAAVVAGLVVFVLVFPASGNASDPPECFSFFGYVVPCGLRGGFPDLWFAGLGAMAAVGLVIAGAAAGRRDRDRVRHDVGV
jgi:hypothetical protein